MKPRFVVVVIVLSITIAARRFAADAEKAAA
jgi:hypothetical protein